MKVRSTLLFLVFVGLYPSPTEAQLRRPGFITIDREDRSKSELVKEEGAVYLEGMVEKELSIRVVQPAGVYSTLGGDRWLGNLLPNQNAVLLAVSDKAYRVRAKAKQGQVAGWVSKSSVTGIPEGFEESLRQYYARYVIVSELIENHQVALGMTVAEVTTSIGPPDKRGSKINSEGRTDTLEYISYERVPQTVTSIDPFGRVVASTQYIEVESGRVQIDFENDTVISLSESEGLNFANTKIPVTVPPPVFLF
ncbi:MAG: hypothetical protein KA250_03285 [Verrucomicrobiales bacterium]|nr:hypothetical protein [Verrucomicrobiales bacterium]MBP9223489.1 hypothetical protein [Verrucomicrobiales bacterium]HQZ26603.1 hypothetical protein [Verrucomicrobiales bacterium]